MASDLILPPGVVENFQEAISVRPEKMIAFANMSSIANEWGLAIVCLKCDKAVQGRNSLEDDVWQVQCGCREWKSQVRKAKITQ